MCFVWIWEQTAIISLHSINWLVFITETECVYCVVRTGYFKFNSGQSWTLKLSYNMHSIFKAGISYVIKNRKNPLLQTFTLLSFVTNIYPTHVQRRFKTHISNSLNFTWHIQSFVSTQVFLAFPVSSIKCWDGSQDSNLLLQASHAALPI
jgi:hypothetical protein